MAKIVFNASVFTGRPLYPADVSTVITVWDAETGELVPTLWADRDGTVELANPHPLAEDGVILFYTDPGRYNITATRGSWFRVWPNHLQIDPDAGLDTSLDPIFFASNYGVVADGATDDSAAMSTAFAAVVAAGGGILQLPAGSIFLESEFTQSSPLVHVRGAGKYSTTLVIAHSGNGVNIATNVEPRLSDLQILRNTIGSRGSRTGVGLRVFGDIAGGSSVQAMVSNVRIRGFAKALDLYGCFLSHFDYLTLKENDVSYYLNNNTNDSITFFRCASNLSVGQHAVCSSADTSAEVGATWISCEFEDGFKFPHISVLGGLAFFLQFRDCYWYENNVGTDSGSTFNFIEFAIAGRLRLSGSGISSAGKQDARLIYGRRNASAGDWDIVFDDTEIKVWRNSQYIIDLDTLAGDDHLHVSPSCKYFNNSGPGIPIFPTSDNARNSLYTEELIGRTYARGYQFPNPPVPVADPYTLDYYHEGTWTPTIQDDSGSPSEGQTYSIQSGTYTRIGNTVVCECQIAVTSLGTLSVGQAVRIGGLPFTSSASVNFSSAIVGSATGLTLSAVSPITGVIAAGATVMGLYKWVATTGSTTLLVSDLGTTPSMTLSFTYKV